MAPHRSAQGYEVLRRIRLMHERLGITKVELARRVGAAVPTVTEWFTQGALPDGEKLARLPSALGVNGHWLLTGDGPMLPPGPAPAEEQRAMRMGAQSVLARLRESLRDLEREYGEDVTARAAAVLRHEAELREAARRRPQAKARRRGS